MEKATNIYANGQPVTVNVYGIPTGTWERVRLGWQIGFGLISGAAFAALSAAWIVRGLIYFGALS